MLRRGCVDVQWKRWEQPAYKLWIAEDKLWMPGGQNCKTQRAKKKPPDQAASSARPLAALFSPRAAYAVSPSTVTLMSTTTSVCSATLTVESPTVLMGPLGMRTCALAIL
jgi:hypothetical protein